MNLRCVEFTLKQISCYSKLWKTRTLVQLPKGKLIYTNNFKTLVLLCWTSLLEGRVLHNKETWITPRYFTQGPGLRCSKAD